MRNKCDKIESGDAFIQIRQNVSCEVISIVLKQSDNIYGQQEKSYAVATYMFRYLIIIINQRYLISAAR